MARSAVHTWTSRGNGALLALLFALLVTHSAPVAGEGGQPPPPPPQSPLALGADFSKSLQQQARAALERHVHPEEFQVFVTATLIDSPSETIPYLPETLAPVPGAETPPEALAPFIKRIDVEVLIADSYDAPAKAKLETILMKTLAMDNARGDTVKFSALGLKIERQESEVARDLIRSEAEARDLKTKLEALNRERDDVKRDFSREQGEVERLTLSGKKQGKDDQGHPTTNGPEATDGKEKPVPKGFFEENAALLVGVVLILLGFLGAGIGLRGAAKVLGAAVQTIGANLPVLGEKLSESLSKRIPDASPKEGNSPLLLPAGQASDPAMSAMAGSTVPLEVVGKMVLELHEELVLAIDETTEGYVLEYLSHLLDEDSTVGRAVATMELLGKDCANALYSRLALDHQQRVCAFLRGGRHQKPKGEVMLEAGEALKTKLFGSSFATLADLGRNVSEKLLLLSMEDQIAVARTLTGDGLARFFLYLEPSRLGTVLTGLREKDSGRLAKALPLIGKIPEVQKAKNLDDQIVTAIDSQLVRVTADLQGPYLSYYRALVQSVDDELAESISEQLALINARVERFVRESIVTFGTFFKLHGDIQEEIVLGMSSRDLAALVSMLKVEHKETILRHVEERQKPLINEEVDRLLAKGTRNVTAAHRAAKKLVLARILQIKGTEPLSQMLAPKTEALPSAESSSTSQAA